MSKLYTLKELKKIDYKQIQKELKTKHLYAINKCSYERRKHDNVKACFDVYGCKTKTVYDYETGKPEIEVSVDRNGDYFIYEINYIYYFAKERNELFNESEFKEPLNNLIKSIEDQKLKEQEEMRQKVEAKRREVCEKYGIEYEDLNFTLESLGVNNYSYKHYEIYDFLQQMDSKLNEDSNNPVMFALSDMVLYSQILYKLSIYKMNQKHV